VLFAAEGRRAMLVAGALNVLDDDVPWTATVSSSHALVVTSTVTWYVWPAATETVQAN